MALFTAAAKILDAPETELGGTIYENDRHGMSLLPCGDAPRLSQQRTRALEEGPEAQGRREPAPAKTPRRASQARGV